MVGAFVAGVDHVVDDVRVSGARDRKFGLSFSLVLASS